MLFRTYQPRHPLSDFIDNLWLYQGYSYPHVRARIFPTGASELVFNLEDDELKIYRNSESSECTRHSGAIVSGPHTAFFGAEEVAMMGVHFRPGGAFPFLAVSAYELLDTHIDLETIWGYYAGELRERLAAMSTVRGRFELLENALRSRLLRASESHPAVSLALDRFHSDNSRAVIRTLARETGLSDRRFIQVFRGEVGLNPKLFQRVERFQRVLQRVYRIYNPDWGQLALEHGYFDQSHLIHDFGEFSGFSPAEYLDYVNALRLNGLNVKFNHFPTCE